MDASGGIEYMDNDGLWVHSDLPATFPRCAEGEEVGRTVEEWRQFLHDNLDEWLDKSEGTGAFYLASAEWWDSTTEALPPEA